MFKLTYIAAIFSVLAFSACTKIIEVDLEEADAQIVIEAPLQEGPQDFTVRISKTGAYFGTSSNPTLDNAVVVLSDDQGSVYPLTFIADGVYETPITGVPNTLYTLNVTVDGESYEAESLMPEHLSLDSLSQEYIAATSFSDEGYQVFMRFQEPGNINNYYRFVNFIDGVETPINEDLMVLDDNIFDGGYAKLPVFNVTFSPGDSVIVELRHMNEPSFDYFFSLSEIIASDGGGPSSSAAPGNPSSNWSNGALGHFSAYAVDTASIVLPN